jgi:hypothetical protein
MQRPSNGARLIWRGEFKNTKAEWVSCGDQAADVHLPAVRARIRGELGTAREPWGPFGRFLLNALRGVGFAYFP